MRIFTITIITTVFFLLSCSNDKKLIKNNNVQKPKIETKTKAKAKATKSPKVNKKAIVLYVKANGFIIDDSFKKVLKLGFEEIATESDYVIIDDEVKKKAYKRVLKEHNWKQNDPRFLVELGKQLSATDMVYITITKLSDESYKLSNRWISLKTGAIKRTKIFNFNYQFNNDTKEILFTKIQKLASYFLHKQIENRIVLSIDSNVKLNENLKKIVKLAFEEVATDNNYSIVDDDTKEKAYKRVLKEHNWKQNDPRFLVALNKQLDANKMIIINLTKEYGDRYLITNRLIDLKTGINIRTKNKLYSLKKDKGYSILFDTIKLLAKEFLCKNCINRKLVYIDLKGVNASNDYAISISNITKNLTKKGYLITQDKNNSDLTFSIVVTPKDKGNLVILKQINKNNQIFKTASKNCQKESIVNCIKLLLTDKFQQKTIMNKWGVEFVEIPKGEFQMGYTGNDALEIEKKNYKKVKITNNFFIAKTETTQKFYKSIMGKNPSKNKCDDCPIESVSFNNITKFIEKLNSIDKKFNYRLPSEAEWEYMVRAGRKTPFFWGDTLASLDIYAWYAGNSSKRIHKIATKKANPWGVFDVVGNVFEFTSSFEKIKYFNKQLFRYGTKNMRIAKGGCFTNKNKASIRPTAHIRIKSESASSSRLGFRLILEKKN